MGKAKGRGKKEKGKKKKGTRHSRDAGASSRPTDASSQSQSEDAAKVDSLARKGRIDQPDGNGVTPLMHACFAGNVGMVELLIEHKASIDKAANDGYTPLLLACLNNHAVVAGLLIEHKASIDKAANYGFTPLCIACQNGHAAVAGLLIEHKASIDKANNNGCNPLFIACQNGHASSAKQLIEHKASIDKATNDGATPLFIACQEDHASCAKLLIEHKASIDNATNDGITSLHTACQNGHAAVAGLLIEHKAQAIDKANNNGVTPLQIACIQGHAAVVGLLIEHGADVNLRLSADTPYAAFTPLHTAISCVTLECAKMLLRTGGARLDLHLGTRTQEFMGVFRGASHTDIAAFVRDTHGFSPLHFACEQRRPARLWALLRSSQGADSSVVLGGGPAIDRVAEEAAIEAEMRATRTCLLRVRTRGSSAGWLYSAPDDTWRVALDGGEDVDVSVAELTRVAVPSLIEVSSDERFGHVCQRTRAIARRATVRWSPTSHHFFPVRFRRAAVAMLCVQHALNTRERVGANAGMAVLSRDVPLLGAWFVVLSMCPRDWFEAAEGAASSAVADDDAAEAEQQQWCEWCGRPSTARWRPRACTGCHLVYYCDSGCSRANWSEHKALCRAQQSRARLGVAD